MFDIGSAGAVLLAAAAAFGLWYFARRPHEPARRKERRHLPDRRAGHRGTSDRRRA